MTDSAPMLIAPPPPGWAPTRTAATGPTGLATASLVLGVVALVLNVLLIPTILAIVFGAVALARGTSGRVRAIVGIVLGALGVLALAIQAAIAIPVFLGLTQHAVTSEVESGITNGLAERGQTVHDLRCTLPSVPRAGTTGTCTASSDAGVALKIDVTFVDSRGGFTYVVGAA